MRHTQPSSTSSLMPPPHSPHFLDEVSRTDVIALLRKVGEKCKYRLFRVCEISGLE